ncbi:hypothetical protein BTI00_07835, partial [Lactobacillus delbrueckii subsp. bulgaricus]|nr:hypothetical protein [Lactobacillus delbrueckii subsp. bulgaricus]
FSRRNDDTSAKFLFFPLAIQRYISLVASKHIDARYIVQNALVPYNVRRCYIVPVFDLKLTG